MAASVLTEAQTDTPCRYGVALHINQPKCQPEIEKQMLLAFATIDVVLDNQALSFVTELSSCIEKDKKEINTHANG